MIATENLLVSEVIAVNDSLISEEVDTENLLVSEVVAAHDAGEAVVVGQGEGHGQLVVTWCLVGDDVAAAAVAPLVVVVVDEDECVVRGRHAPAVVHHVVELAEVVAAPGYLLGVPGKSNVQGVVSTYQCQAKIRYVSLTARKRSLGFIFPWYLFGLLKTVWEKRRSHRLRKVSTFMICEIPFKQCSVPLHILFEIQNWLPHKKSTHVDCLKACCKTIT